MNNVLKEMIYDRWCDSCSKNVQDCIKADKCFGDKEHKKENDENVEKKSV